MTRNGKGAHKDGYVQLPALRLHYIDYGESGETIIALHGLIQNARAFDAIVPALVPHVRLIALDLRGRGGSDWRPSDSYRWTYYLNDLRGFFQALQIPRFALLGSSVGVLKKWRCLRNCAPQAGSLRWHACDVGNELA